MYINISVLIYLCSYIKYLRHHDAKVSLLFERAYARLLDFLRIGIAMNNAYHVS